MGARKRPSYPMSRFAEQLVSLKSQNRLRGLTLPNGIDFSSNDYLGMREHPALKQAAVEAVQSGVELGSGGSRLLRGHHGEHANLESYAAEYFGSEKSLYFATGFQANLAVLQALTGRHDVILYDEYVHASAREGIRASDAKSFKFNHNDLDHLNDILHNLNKGRKAEGALWVVVESLYSMDGDYAPLEEIKKLADAYDAYIIIDEAHGLAERVEGKQPENIIIIHTCGKVMGVAGALVCASAEIIDFMINTARGFIYSTAPPPLQAYLVQKSLEILGGKEGDDRRAQLRGLVQHMGAESYIVPILIGDDGEAVRIASAMQERGYDIRAIRPPTVPKGTARLRLSLNILHNQKALDQMLLELDALRAGLPEIKAG